MPDVLVGTAELGKVFNRPVNLDGYQAMADRQALKVLVHP